MVKVRFELVTALAEAVIGGIMSSLVMSPSNNSDPHGQLDRTKRRRDADMMMDMDEDGPSLGGSGMGQRGFVGVGMHTAFAAATAGGPAKKMRDEGDSGQGRRNRHNAENLSNVLSSSSSSSSSTSTSSLSPSSPPVSSAGGAGGMQGVGIPRVVQGMEKKARRATAAASSLADTGDNGEIQHTSRLLYQEDRSQYLEDNVSHLRGELSRVVERKDAEIAVLRQETTVLKKGIAIQNSRQREAFAQNAQLQEVLSRAAEHIAGLERAVQLLQSRLAFYESGGANDGLFSPPPPPDCF